MMSCQQAAMVLNEYLDKELSQEDVRALEEHLRACERCFGRFEFDKALRRVLKNQVLRRKLSPDVKALISEKLERDTA